ncbi:glycosyltransferase family 39 protein [Dyadobacter sediminis]|uniref:Glycosyltransferase family 39 protein n=2 Tax=Dyadobacter sediminis TaxID=1493691 RepID=A0A5R9K5N9_9BACT|nr:glycosyltransferase family 39 protein [Dyadobacter sediminis]
MIFLIPLAIWLSTVNCYLAFYKDALQSFRRSLLTAATGIFFFIAAATELLSAVNLINTVSVSSAWIILNVFLIFWYQNLKSRQEGEIWQTARSWVLSSRAFLKNLGALTQGILFTLSGITFLVAVIAPPNNMDALSYHLSRLGYWIQNGNVEHYASHIERAISFSPFSEYIHLHTFLLLGNERVFQLVQWLCLAGILAYISLLVELFSGTRSAMRIALCFAATLPIVVLESMTTQNDLVVAFFILASAFYVFDYAKNRSRSALILLVLSVSLGMMTKGTFVFYALPFGLYLFFFMFFRQDLRKSLAYAVAYLTLGVLWINMPFWLRTYELFQTPIGTVTNGNKNDFGNPAGFISSVSKHTFLHLGFISPQNRYNAFMEAQLKSIHEAVGVPLHESGYGMDFKMNKLNFNEDFAHNFIGMLLILLSLPLLLLTNISRNARWYAGLAFASFLVFCLFISYQVYGSRLHIPFFLLISPVIGLVYSSVLKFVLTRFLLIILWICALPFALLSVTHPLLSTRWFFEKIFPVINSGFHLNINTDNLLNLKQESILYSSPEKIIWGDNWIEIQSLKYFVDSLQARKIGFDFTEASLDYGYQYILRAPERHFEHIAVRNASSKLENPAFVPDCIISEHDEGSVFSYHGKIYFKKWSGTFRWIYVPEKYNQTLPK